MMRHDDDDSDDCDDECFRVQQDYSHSTLLT
jgi:hypothetical protein